MNVDSDDDDNYTRTTYCLFSRIQNCEQDLMQHINNQGRDPCGLSVNSDFSNASKMKSPSKKQRPFAGGPYGEDAAFFLELLATLRSLLLLQHLLINNLLLNYLSLSHLLANQLKDPMFSNLLPL
jgi:hypothetical protein